MDRQIVAGYNSTPSSTEAVLWAAAEAAARKWKLRVVLCYELPIARETGGASLLPGLTDSIVDGATRSAEAIRVVIAERHPDIDVAVEVLAGPAPAVLVHGLDAADLLVVGSSSHEGAAALWLGNSARFVIRHSPCPVVVVRGAASRGRPDRIVVGVDGSVPSGFALMWAADEADLHRSELVVVHSWQYPYLGLDARGKQVRDLTRIDAACVLEEAVELARKRCGMEVTGVLVESSSVSALLDTVRDGDLLVLGSRGRGAVVSGLFGSTVNSVVDQAAVPVVVVREGA